jgi:hypothetical protein
MRVVERRDAAQPVAHRRRILEVLLRAHPVTDGDRYSAMRLDHAKSAFIGQIVADEYRRPAGKRRLLQKCADRRFPCRIHAALSPEPCCRPECDTDCPAVAVIAVSAARSSDSNCGAMPVVDRPQSCPCPRGRSRDGRAPDSASAVLALFNRVSTKLAPWMAPDALRRTTPCSPAAGKRSGANSESRYCRLRPLTNATAPPSRSTTCLNISLSSSSTKVSKRRIGQLHQGAVHVEK